MEEHKFSINMESIITDAANQFFIFNIIEDEEDLKGAFLTIQEKEGGLKTLEQWTGKTREELNKARPNICENYNALVERLKKPNLAVAEAREIYNEAIKVIYNH